MTFLIIDGERYALQSGETTLGGAVDELLRDSPLATLPPFAVISWNDSVRIRAMSPAVPVTVNGVPLDAHGRELRHGDRVSVHDVDIHVGELDKAGRTDHQAGVTDAALALRSELVIADPTASTGGTLTAFRDGRQFVIPERGLTIGRDPDCGVVLTSRAVSRRHARLEAGLLGYSLVDESSNGVLVNGRLVEGTCLLSQGDEIRVGDERFRFDADSATYEPDAAVFAAPALPLRVVDASPLPPTQATDIIPSATRPPAPPAQSGVLLATLQVMDGTRPSGALHRVERPVVQVGRGVQNDIRLADDSVSGAHATLLQRGGAWVLLDLGSRNGSYVEGQRVTECVLQGVCELRLGAVTLLFRPIATATAERIRTLGVFGVTDAQLGQR